MRIPDPRFCRNICWVFALFLSVGAHAAEDTDLWSSEIKTSQRIATENGRQRISNTQISVRSHQDQNTQLFIESANTMVESTKVEVRGDDELLPVRLLDHRLVYPIVLGPNESIVIDIVQRDHGPFVPLWSVVDVNNGLKKISKEQGVLVAGLSMLFMLVLSQIAIFIVFRDVRYLGMAATIATGGLFLFAYSGMAGPLLGWGRGAAYAFMLLAFGTMIGFGQLFLRTQRHSPIVHTILGIVSKSFLFAGLVLPLYAMAIPLSDVEISILDGAISVAILAMLLLTGVAARRAFEKDRDARYFLLVAVILFASAVVTVITRGPSSHLVGLIALVTGYWVSGLIWCMALGSQLYRIKLRHDEEKRAELGALADQRAAERDEELHHRQAAEAAQRQSQLRFERAFEHAPIGLALLTTQGEILQINRTFANLFGMPRESLHNVDQIFTESGMKRMTEALQSLCFSTHSKLNFEAETHAVDGESRSVEVGVVSVPNEKGTAITVVLQVLDVTESKKLADDLHRQAMHDPLTGLGNRRQLDEILMQEDLAFENGEHEYALLLLDLDQFKAVNDTSGHPAGDALLVEISHLLKDSVRSGDSVVRLGGDEFAIVLSDCPSTIALQISEKIRNGIENLVFNWEGTTHRVGVSIGVVSVAEPGICKVDMLRRADTACFAAKEGGRNQVHMDTDSEAVENRKIELGWVPRINHALDNDNFVLHAQRILPLQEEQDIEQYEILVRMRDRETGKVLMPAAFIPVAERFGLSSKIDRWVVTQAVRLATVQYTVFDVRRKYWINLSGVSIGDDVFLEYLCSVLSHSPLPRGSINFEITETAMIKNVDQATRSIRRLHSLGCSIALDDFGTGLSSFGYLKSLPVDKVKIDGYFVKNITTNSVDRDFVKAIIDISHSMKLEAVVEYVEDEDIWNCAVELGADYGQGYAIEKPTELLPASWIEGWTADSPTEKLAVKSCAHGSAGGDKVTRRRLGRGI